MALSFEESMRIAAEQQAAQNAIEDVALYAAMPAIADTEIAADMPMILNMTNEDAGIAAYAGDMDEWTLCDDKYRYYAEYSDDTVSIVDGMKNVTV